MDKAIIERVEAVAKKRGVAMATVATAWCLSKGANPITGLGSRKRIDQAVQAVAFQLEEDEVKYLEEPYVPKEVQGH